MRPTPGHRPDPPPGDPAAGDPHRRQSRWRPGRPRGAWAAGYVITGMLAMVAVLRLRRRGARLVVPEDALPARPQQVKSRRALAQHCPSAVDQTVPHRTAACRHRHRRLRCVDGRGQHLQRRDPPRGPRATRHPGSASDRSRSSPRCSASRTTPQHAAFTRRRRLGSCWAPGRSTSSASSWRLSCSPSSATTSARGARCSSCCVSR